MDRLLEASIKDARNRRYAYIPEWRSRSLQEWLEGWFKARFGSMGYWQSPKDCKAAHYASCVAELLIGIDIELQHDRPDDREPTELW